MYGPSKSSVWPYWEKVPSDLSWKATSSVEPTGDFELSLLAANSANRSGVPAAELFSTIATSMHRLRTNGCIWSCVTWSCTGV